MDSQNYIQNLVYTVGKELEKNEQDLDLIVQKFKNEWVNKKEDLEEILEDETSWSQFVQKAQIPFKLALKIKKTVQMKQTKQQSSNMHDKFIKKMLEQASLPQSEQIRKEILQQNSQNHQDQNEFVYIPTDIEELPFDSQEFQENPVIAKLFSFTNGQIKIFKAKGSSILVNSEEKKQKNSPRNCWTSVFIPLKSEEKIRDKFIRFDKTNIRYGKLLEVVDSLAGYSSYYYVYNSPEYAIVTASFDHIIFLDQIDPEEDLTINVYPSSIGTASIEIKIDMFQNNKLKITSLIVMVSVPTKQGKRKPFPHYDIENDPDHEILKKLYLQGQENQKIRKQQRIQNNNASFSANIAQQHEEILLFLQTYQSQSNSKMIVNMSDTVYEKYMPMHIQDRNIHYKIFGGYILREAFEIGFLAAYDIGGGYMPHIQFVDDVQFISPVEIGAVLKFKATVTCVLKGYAYIIVECIRIIFDHDNNKKIHQKTNDLKLIFHVGDKAKDVIPVAYQEVLQFIKGKDQLIKRVFAPMELQNQQAKINQ